MGGSIGLGPARIGVSTRGVRASVAGIGVSAGRGGVRGSVGVPGVGGVSVNPIRPSVRAYAGPFSVAAKPRTGLSARVGTSLVAVGVATKPMMWARVGPMVLAIPGDLTPSSKRWHEEIDDQWRPYAQKRPRSFMASLSELIDATERDEVMLANAEPVAPTRPAVPGARGVATQERDAILAQRVAAARSGVAWYRRRAKREAVEQATADAAAQVERLAAERRREAEEFGSLVLDGFERWEAGDPTARLIVANAALSANGADAFVVGLDGDDATVAVLLPDLEQIHPEKPDLTAGGARTVRKRTRAERAEVHRRIAQAHAVHAIHCARAVLPDVCEWRFVFAEFDPAAASLADLDVIVDVSLADSDIAQLPSHRLLWDAMVERGSNAGQRLGSVLPEALLAREDARAVAVGEITPADLGRPGFWFAVAEALRDLDD